MKKIAILGCGQLGSIVADAIASGLLPGYTLCAAMSRKLPDAEALCAKAGGAACVTLDEVLAQKPDYVVETAAVQVAKESCLPVLEAGLGFIPISIGVDADYGSLEAGRWGNVILVDDQLNIQTVVRHGEVL